MNKQEQEILSLRHELSQAKFKLERAVETASEYQFALDRLCGKVLDFRIALEDEILSEKIFWEVKGSDHFTEMMFATRIRDGLKNVYLDQRVNLDPSYNFDDTAVEAHNEKFAHLQMHEFYGRDG